jgi:epoxide hydrolase
MFDLPAVGPFRPTIPAEVLRDLDDRLARTRWTEDGVAAGGRYGVDRHDLQTLVDAWRTFDWAAAEERLARSEHVRVDCGSHVLHAMRLRAAEPQGTVVLLHGWPSSFLEMERLGDALARAGSAPAFDVVIPSLPGFGFSDPLGVPGPSSYENAQLMLTLLTELGVDRFWVHAYDIAASTGARMALLAPDRVLGYHTTEPGIPRADWDESELTDEELRHRRFAAEWHAHEGGYLAIQSTRPLTLAYALTDSPVGLAAWVFDKWQSWTVAPDEPWRWDTDLTAVLLETLTLYWATGSIGSANRVYFGSDKHGVPFERSDQLACPVGVALTTQQIERAPEAMARRLFPDIRVWTDLGRGGHFVAAQAPSLIADNIRRLVAAG